MSINSAKMTEKRDSVSTVDGSVVTICDVLNIDNSTMSGKHTKINNKLHIPVYGAKSKHSVVVQNNNTSHTNNTNNANSTKLTHNKHTTHDTFFLTDSNRPETAHSVDADNEHYSIFPTHKSEVNTQNNSQIHTPTAIIRETNKAVSAATLGMCVCLFHVFCVCVFCISSSRKFCKL